MALMPPQYYGVPPPLPPPSSSASTYHAHTHPHAQAYMMHAQQMAAYQYPPSGYMPYPGAPGGSATEMAAHAQAAYGMLPEFGPGHLHQFQQQRAQVHHEPPRDSQERQARSSAPCRQEMNLMPQSHEGRFAVVGASTVPPAGAESLLLAAAAGASAAGHTASTKSADRAMDNADALEALVRMGNGVAKPASCDVRPRSPAGSSDASGSSTSGIAGDLAGGGAGLHNTHKRARR
jgi:hypothetical protein